VFIDEKKKKMWVDTWFIRRQDLDLKCRKLVVHVYYMKPSFYVHANAKLGQFSCNDFSCLKFPFPNQFCSNYHGSFSISFLNMLLIVSDAYNFRYLSSSLPLYDS